MSGWLANGLTIAAVFSMAVVIVLFYRQLWRTERLAEELLTPAEHASLRRLPVGLGWTILLSSVPDSVGGRRFLAEERKLRKRTHSLQLTWFSLWMLFQYSAYLAGKHF